MSDVIELSVPKSWKGTTERQRMAFFEAVANDEQPTEAKIHCLDKWTGLKIIASGNDFVVARWEKILHTLHLWQLYAVIGALSWLDSIPSDPIGISKIGKHKCCAADFSDLDFEHWLSIESLYQGFLLSNDFSLLEQAAQIVAKSDKIKPDRPTLWAVFYWIASVKNHFAWRFQNFFSSAENSGSVPSPQDIRTSIMAQIRALTDGDVTKTKQVLACPCLDALQELDFKAKEFLEMQKKYGSI